MANGMEKHIQSLGCKKLHPVLWQPDVMSAPLADAPNMPVHAMALASSGHGAVAFP